MAVDIVRWRERGHHLRALESLRGGPHATTREAARAIVRVTFVAALAALSPDDQETAVGIAAEGYVDEHLARGGTLVGS
ncbi:MAG: hypothetical protein JWM10_3077 [Myxococcaceae bacterium]|nr:hypothetical protein [Myxococcaceae bacterium]